MQCKNINRHIPHICKYVYMSFFGYGTKDQQSAYYQANTSKGETSTGTKY